jgi:hypothetical protein
MSLVSDLKRALAPRSFVIRSPLSKDASIQRIRTAIDSDWKIMGVKPVIGMEFAGRFRLRKRLRRSFHNSWQTVIRVEFKGLADQSEIICKTGLNVTAWPFMAIWFGFVGALEFTFIVRGAPWFDDVFGSGFIIFALSLFCWARYSARDEADFVTGYIAQTVGGVIVTDLAKL